MVRLPLGELGIACLVTRLEYTFRYIRRGRVGGGGGGAQIPSFFRNSESIKTDNETWRVDSTSENISFDFHIMG